MYSAKEFEHIKDANEYIKKLLAEIETPKDLEFQIIHSVDDTECCEDGGDWETISEMLISYLRDLDSQQGYMILDEDKHWDYLEWEEIDDHVNIYKPEDDEEIFVHAGEGVAVIFNKFALCEEEFPIVVIKKSFWRKLGTNIFNILKKIEVGTDYTSRISPAIYVELFESETILAC